MEINFELRKDAHGIFEKNLDPERIVRELSLIARKRIIPGKTLLFLDEIQIVPEAIRSLRLCIIHDYTALALLVPLRTTRANPILNRYMP